jgi:hypothetical protein
LKTKILQKTIIKKTTKIVYTKIIRFENKAKKKFKEHKIKTCKEKKTRFIFISSNQIFGAIILPDR